MKNIYKFLLAILMVAASVTGNKAKAQTNYTGFEYSTRCLTVSLWATDKRGYDSCAQVKYAINGSYVTGVQATYTFTTAGTYTVCMKIYNPCKKWDTSVCKSVTVKSCDTNSCDLKPDFQWKNSCLKTQFSATGGISGASYSWSFGDGTSGSGSDPYHAYSKTGTYKVCLTVKWIDKNTGKTCYKTVCKEVKISCGTDCNIKGDFFYASQGGYTKFGAYSTGGYYYEWSFGDGTYGTGQYPTHQYKKPGTYTVCVKIYDKTKRCSIKICKTVVIKEPCSVRATFAWVAGSNGLVKFAAVSFGGYKYVWDFGDGTTGSGEDVSHTYSKPGTYKVCLTVYSKSGYCKTTICKTVTVGGSTSRCNWAAMGAGFGYQISCPKLYLEAKTLVNGSSCIKYAWAITPANTNQTSYYYGRVQGIQLASGVYNVCLKLVDSCHKCDTVICKTITVNCNTSKCDLSKAGFGYSVNCRKVTLEGNNMGTGCYKYYWNINGVVYNGRIAYYNFPNNGTYKICYKVLDSCNKCDTMICKEIKIDCQTKCDWSKAGFAVKVDCRKVTAEAYNLGGCHVYAFVLSNSSGSGSSSNGRFFSWQAPANGSYTLCMKIKDTCNNCDTTICQTVKVNCDPCNWTGGGFAYSNKCRDYSFEAKNMNNGCVQYYWSVAGVSAGSGRLMNYSFSKTGTYVVCLKMYDTCKRCDTVICQNVKVDCNPCKATAKFTVDSVSKSGVAYITNHSSGAAYYVWDFGDSTFSYQQNPGKHAYSSSGTRTICLTVYDSLKTCSTKYCVTISVVKSRSTASVSGVETLRDIQIFPNPTSDYFNISIGNAAGTYQVMNLQGQVVVSGSIQNETSVTTTGWAEGIYLVKTVSNGAQNTTRVVVVRQ
jgi:PKD repeat protein